MSFTVYVRSVLNQETMTLYNNEKCILSHNNNERLNVVIFSHKNNFSQDHSGKLELEFPTITIEKQRGFNYSDVSHKENKRTLREIREFVSHPGSGRYMLIYIHDVMSSTYKDLVLLLKGLGIKSFDIDSIGSFMVLCYEGRILYDHSSNREELGLLYFISSNLRYINIANYNRQRALVSKTTYDDFRYQLYTFHENTKAHLRQIINQRDILQLSLANDTYMDTDEPSLSEAVRVIDLYSRDLALTKISEAGVEIIKIARHGIQSKPLKALSLLDLYIETYENIVGDIHKKYK